MKKRKNETALVKEALRVVMADAVKRGIVEFEPTDPGLEDGEQLFVTTITS